MPRLTLVTPVYNAERFVSRTLESVLSQTLQDWEYVIVDDGSTDRTTAIVEPFASGDPRIRFIHQPNVGAIAARNKGYAASDRSSSYLLFLDGDDVLEPQMLEVMTAYLDQHPEVGMAFCDVSWIDANDNPIVYGSPGTRYVPSRLGVRQLGADQPETPFISLFFWGRVSPSISVLRRTAYTTTGGWSEDQGWYCEDLDLWLRVALRHHIHYVPDKLVRKRIHGENWGLLADGKGQERRLYKRWLHADWLGPAEQRMVHDAWRLRQRRLLPHLWLSWGTGYLRCGHFRQAVTCYLRSAKRLATYAAAAAKCHLPEGPVW